MAKPILLYTPIFEDTAENITNQLLNYQKGDDVKIWMNTPGGAISSGYSILAALNELELKADITVVGDAASFGFFMLLFAEKSRAYDTSSFMVHRAASFWENIMTEDELKEIEKRNDVLKSKMVARLNEEKFKEVTNYSFDQIFTMTDRLDVNLTAQQAKEIGLIDEVITLDISKRNEIENRYYNEIAALAMPQKKEITNININKNKMGKSLKELIFGEKDPILLASIGDKQVAYSKLEVGAQIKATGKESNEVLSGTFEAENKEVTVIDNEITAVKESDKGSKEIEALKAGLKAVSENQLTAEEVAGAIIESNEKHIKRIEALEAALAKAKITASKPELPEGEFMDEAVKPVGDKEYRIRKSIEAKAAERQAKRNAKLKGGIK